MLNIKLKNDLPIFGRDIIDDWSFDREEEMLREENESNNETDEDSNESSCNDQSKLGN